MIDNVKMFLSSNLIIVQNLVAVSSVWSQVSQSLGTLGPTYRIQIRGVDEPLESCTPSCYRAEFGRSGQTSWVGTVRGTKNWDCWSPAPLGWEWLTPRNTPLHHVTALNLVAIVGEGR